MSRFERARPLAIAAAAALALTACEEASVPETEVEEVTVAPELPVEAGSRAVTLAEFSAHVDPDTHEMVFEMKPVEEWENPPLSYEDRGQFRTVPQALWCERAVGDGNNRFRISTVSGSIGTTLADCGIPENFATIGQGAYCGDVQILSEFEGIVQRPTVEIPRISTGFRPWTWAETEGVIGVDPATLVGPGAPNPLAVFGYPDLARRESARATWAFQNSGGLLNLSFDGRIVAHAFEECNGVDDDCDGLIDEGAGCAALAEACVTHPDCESGNCDAGFCAASLCENFAQDGSESDVDCGGTCDGCLVGQMCTAGGDCASGYCREGLCVQNRLPAPGEIVFTEILANSGVSAESDFEWFEFTNVSGETLDLDGCSITDGEQTIDLVGVTIDDGVYQVVARELNPSDPAHDAAHAAHAAALPANTIFHDEILLADGGDELELYCPGSTGPVRIDEITYGGHEPARREALQVHEDQITASGNSAEHNRCRATELYHPNYYGTPGGPNTTCNVTITDCDMAGATNVVAPVGVAGAFAARVSAPGLTDRSVGTDETSIRFRVDVGFGPTGTDPVGHRGEWTWTSASPDTGWNDAAAPDFDQYLGSLVALGDPDDTVDVAFRVTGDNGATYTQCDGRGTLTTLAPVGPVTSVGDIVISEIMMNVVGAEPTGEWFEIYNTTENPIDLNGCVFYDDGIDFEAINTSVVIFPGAYGVFAFDATAPNGAGAENVIFDYGLMNLGNGGDEIYLDCEIGGSLVTIDSVYYTGSEDEAGVSVQVDPTANDFGSNDDRAVWCQTPPSREYDAGSGAQRGTPGEANAPCYEVSFCRTHSPDEILDATAGATATVTARIEVPGESAGGATADSSLLTGEVGYGADGSDPDAGGWTWTSAAVDPGYNSGVPDYEYDYDEWTADFTIPAGGPFDVAYRFSADGGATWMYCDTNGSDDGYDPADSVAMTVAPTYTVSECVFTTGLNTTSIYALDVGYVEAEITIPGLTEPAGVDPAPSVLVEHGYGADGTNPDSWTNWEEASADSGCAGTCDVYAAIFEIPSASGGPYDQAFRVSGNGGLSWTYCDGNGLPFASGDAGSIIPDPWDVGFCAIWDDTEIEVSEGETFETFGSLYVPGLTDLTGGVTTHEDLVVQFGYGPQSLPFSAFTWNNAQPFDGDGNNDVYYASRTAPVEENYFFLYRVSGDGGDTWTECGDGGFFTESGSNAPGYLTVTAAVANDLPYSEGFSGQDGKGWVGPTPTSNLSGVTWTMDISDASLSASSDWFRVTSGQLEARDVDGVSYWYSPSLAVSGAENIGFSMDLSESGTMEPYTAGSSADFVQVEYSFDGTNWYLVHLPGSPTGYTIDDDFTSEAISVQVPANGSGTFQLRVGIQNGAGSEYHRLDNVEVETGDTCSNATLDCDDSNPCTLDGCGASGCYNVAVACAAGTTCNGAGICAP